MEHDLRASLLKPEGTGTSEGLPGLSHFGSTTIEPTSALIRHTGGDRCGWNLL
jgi:hypothetical protein